MMDSLMNYHIQSRLGSSVSSATFKAKHISTETVCVLKGISCGGLSDHEQKILNNKIKSRADLKHPNVLDIFGFFEDNDVIYLKQEFCENGTLKHFIEKHCKKEKKYLHEELLCKILYQTAFALKTIECFIGRLSLSNILLDGQYNVKLYNFYTDKSNKQQDPKMLHLGLVMYELCTLKQFNKTTHEKEISQLDYSKNLTSLIVSMVKDDNEIKKNINKVLCHPTILLKSNQWSKERCFLHNLTIKTSLSNEIIIENSTSSYSQNRERLKIKEAALRMKDHVLKEKERKLENKEKRIHVMERKLKEKLQQAELYLKRCRECKSVSSGSSKSSTQSRSSMHSKKKSYEELDSTYVSCSDSVVMPTSTKINLENILKPHNFRRTLPERRIRFKTSPLKENSINRRANSRNSSRRSKILEEMVEIRNFEDLNREVKEQIKEKTTTRKKTPFGTNIYENEFMVENTDCCNKTCEIEKIGWTEENKKYAFDLLRIMNSDEKENIDVKHTYL